MVNENKFSQEMERAFGDAFVQLEKQHHYLSDIWANCTDPYILLEMLSKSYYKQHYFEELCAFWVWLDGQHPRQQNWVDPADKIRAARAKLEADDLTPSDGVDEKLWWSAWGEARHALELGPQYQINEALWDNKFPESKAEEFEFKNRLRLEVQASQAQKLIELIPDPFLPKLPSRT